MHDTPTFKSLNDAALDVAELEQRLELSAFAKDPMDPQNPMNWNCEGFAPNPN